MQSLIAPEYKDETALEYEDGTAPEYEDGTAPGSKGGTAFDYEDGAALVSQATPFAERGRVWSRCNYRVVAEERNYRPLRLGNKMLTSAKHVVT